MKTVGVRARFVGPLATVLACSMGGCASEEGGNDSADAASGGLDPGTQTQSGSSSESESSPTGHSESNSGTRGDSSGSGPETDSASGNSDGQPIKFDVSAPDGGANCGAGGMMGDETFSYIWIANSSQGTVSKINTQTLVEEGRYIVREDSAGNPSRTSVNLSGDVAVANRAGGVVKIWANVDDCQESNGMPGIQTSSGPDDVLPWGVEECIAWYTPFPQYGTQRPLAWTQGTFNQSTCQYENQKIWTSGRAGLSQPGPADVVLMDGDTGVVEETVTVASSSGWAGLYGGAVDGEGNFWTVDHDWSAGASELIRVNMADFTYDSWPTELEVHYGLAVDSEGRAWLCGGGVTSRFDPTTETWTHPANPTPSGSVYGGCMTDGDGILWHSRNGDGMMLGIDTETLDIVQSHPLPAYVHGVSIDFDGYVWGVEFSGSNAYRLDPQTGQVDTVSGLVGAYTYSDMTGFALSSAGVPSG